MGIGYDILVDIIKYISPTHVVKICISSVSKNLPAGAFWLDDDNSDVPTVVEVNSARRDSFNRSYEFIFSFILVFFIRQLNFSFL